jgi:hypothetical protein
VAEGEAAGDGLSVIAAGDVTNDGTDDVVLGSRFNDAGGTDAGAVYVLEGGAGLASTSTVDLGSAVIAARILGSTASGRLGNAAAIGDVSGDGVNDLVVAASNLTANGRSRSGGIYILHGPISGTYDLANASSYDTAVFGEAANVLYGSDLAIADLIGNSDLDLVVGAAQGRNGGDQVGEVEVWTGPVATGSVDASIANADVTVFGSLRDYVGGAVALGDANGDGRSDLLVGGGLDDTSAGTDAGGAVLVIGSSSLNALINFDGTARTVTISGPEPRALTGYIRDSVALGDINGDGRADWCVGSRLADTPAGANAGRIDCFESPY